MLNYLHNFLPQPILFQWGFLTVYWYGLFVVSGIVAGLVVVLRLAKRQGISSDEVYNLGFYLVIFSLLGARLYSVLLDLPYYLANPFEIVAVWHGGLAIHGGIIGGAITLLIYSWKKRQSFWLWADLIAVALPLGQAIGRWGNYFNQEIFGQPTDLAWGIPITLANRPLEYLSSQYFHPTFLYESGLNLVNFVVLLSLFFWLKKRNQKPNLPTGGFIILFYLINYSLIRIGMEFLRLDTTPAVFGVRLPILVSLGVIGLSIVFLFLKIFRLDKFKL